MALVLKLNSAVEVEIDSTGKILLPHWNIPAMQAMQGSKALKNSNIRAFMEQFIFELGRKYDESITNKKVAYDSGERIKNIKEITNLEFEKIAEVYINSELNSLLSIPLEEENKNVQLLKIRLEGETAQEYLVRLVEASIESFNIQNKKMLEQFSNIAKKWREPLIKSNLAINELNSQFDEIKSINIPPVPIHDSPIHKTNGYLSNANKQLEKLALLTETEIDQAKLLNDKSTSLLEASAESSEQAKRSIYIATGAIIISAVLSIWSIIETRKGNDSTGESLYELINNLKVNGEAISSNINELNKLMKELKLNQQIQNTQIKKPEFKS